MKVTKEEVLRELAAYTKLTCFAIQVTLGVEADGDMVIAFISNKWSVAIVRSANKIASKLSKRHGETYTAVVHSTLWFNSYTVDSGFSEYIEDKPKDDAVVLKCGDDELPLPFNREQFELIVAMSREIWKVFERV